MLVIVTNGAASGKAGGFVASRGRAGAQFRAHTINRQPRSASQLLARALTGSLAPAWRALTNAQRQGWAHLASTVLRTDAHGQELPLSGYALFVSCSRNLLSIAGAIPNTAPPTTPAFPALTTFSATAIYTAPAPNNFLAGFALAWTTAALSPFAGLVRASAALSPTRGNVRPSDLRIIAALNPLPPGGMDLFNTWVTTFGTPPPIGTVTFSLNLVDPASGFASPAVRATAPINAALPNPYIPGDILIEIEGTPVAVLTDQVIEFNDNPQAGG
jgi:hypothetical protein